MPEIRHLEPTDVAREQLRLFLGTAAKVGLDDERLCRTLRLSRDDWQHWLGILQDAPLPAHPALPLLLRHLGFLTNRLDRAAGASYA
jgi:hypothetical protein